MKVSVINNTMSVISKYSLADIKKAAKFCPEALTLYKGEGKEKEAIFKVMTGTTGSATAYGVCYADETKVGTPVAIVTEIIPAHVDAGSAAVKEWVREKLGLNFVAYCNEIEAQIDDALKDLAEAQVAMDAAIEIAGEPTEDAE